MKIVVGTGNKRRVTEIATGKHVNQDTLRANVAIICQLAGIK